MSKTKQNPHEETKPKLNRKRRLQHRLQRQKLEAKEPVSARLLDPELKPMG